MAYPDPQSGDSYDPWTRAGRCRQIIEPRRRGMLQRRCLNRTTHASGLCWRHDKKENP